jgi:branched-subunit amino acid transport protein
MQALYQLSYVPITSLTALGITIVVTPPTRSTPPATNRVESPLASPKINDPFPIL